MRWRPPRFRCSSGALGRRHDGDDGGAAVPRSPPSSWPPSLRRYRRCPRTWGEPPTAGARAPSASSESTSSLPCPPAWSGRRGSRVTVGKRERKERKRRDRRDGRRRRAARDSQLTKTRAEQRRSKTSSEATAPPTEKLSGSRSDRRTDHQQQESRQPSRVQIQ